MKGNSNDVLVAGTYKHNVSCKFIYNCYITPCWLKATESEPKTSQVLGHKSRQQRIIYLYTLCGHRKCVATSDRSIIFYGKSNFTTSLLKKYPRELLTYLILLLSLHAHGPHGIVVGCS